MFVLNPQSGTPIYRQLIAQITRLIAGGQLAVGTELPSVRELAVRHAVNSMTISRAYSLLESEGLLVRNRGKPMTIAKPARAQAPLAKRLEQLEPQAEQIALAARQLELSEKDAVKALHDAWEKTDDQSVHRRTRPR